MADDPTPTPDPSPTPTSDPAPDPVPDEAAKWKALARKHEAEAKRLKGIESEFQSLREASQSEQEKALTQARQEADKAARAEERARSNRRILTAEIKAAAGRRLNDPADAVRLLDLDQFEVDDDGEVDTKALASAIDSLLKEKPYLAANGDPPKKPGSPDAGPRTTPTKPVDDSPRSLITAGLAANEEARSRH